MNEEIEKTSRSGADSISNDVVAGQTQTVEVVTENVENKTQEIENDNIISSVEPKMNITVDKKGGKVKKEKKNRNTRTTLLVLIVLLVVVVSIGVTYLKIQDLKAKYKIEKEVESVFDESVERKEDSDLKYVAKIDDTYSFNDLSYKSYEYKNGQIEDSNNKIPYDQVYHSFRIVQVSGLKDKNIEKMINDTLLNAALSLEGTPESHVNGYESVMGNFGNILSIQINYSVGRSDTIYKGYNFNLETGEQINFNDIFVSSAPIASIISDAILKSAAWTIDKDNKSSGGGYYSDIANIDFSEAEDLSIKAVNYYKELNGNLNFTVSTDGVTIYDLAEKIIPKSERMYTRKAYIDLTEYKDYVAIYKRFASNKDLYEKKLGNDDAYVFVNMQGLYSMSPECRYVINENNFFADMYLSYIADDLMPLAKNYLDKYYLNNLRNTSMQNPNNYYNFSGTMNFSNFAKPDYIDYTNKYSIQNGYLYYNGVRYSMRLEVALDVLKNSNKEKFIAALISTSSSPYASIGSRSIGSFDKTNCETNYFYKTLYFKEDGSVFLEDDAVYKADYVSPYPSEEEMIDFIYKHDSEYSWFFQRRGYNIKYKDGVYDNDPNYYDNYTIINERARMLNGEDS